MENMALAKEIAMIVKDRKRISIPQISVITKMPRAQVEEAVELLSLEDIVEVRERKKGWTQLVYKG